MLAEYEFRDTFVHRLNPYTKCILYGVTIAFMIIWTDPIYCAALCVLPLTLNFLARFPWRKLVTPMKALTPMLIMITLFYSLVWAVPLVRTPQTVIFYIFPPEWPFPLGGLGFRYGASLLAIGLLFRIIAAFMAINGFFYTTSTTDVIQIMTKAGIPYQFGITWNMAYRFGPTMKLKGKEIIEAQRARGWESEKGSLFKRIMAIKPVLVPLFDIALDMANKVALAMEARAFGAKKDFTYLKAYKFRLIDWFLSALTTVIFVISVCALIFYQRGSL